MSTGHRLYVSPIAPNCRAGTFVGFNADTVLRVGSHPVLVQHGEEAIFAAETRHNKNDVSEVLLLVLRRLLKNAQFEFRPSVHPLVYCFCTGVISQMVAVAFCC